VGHDDLGAGDRSRLGQLASVRSFTQQHEGVGAALGEGARVGRSFRRLQPIEGARERGESFGVEEP
jgi:hypothetical protein